MDIRQCIADLLTQHDCVIVPGLGGFIGNYAPARIDPVHHAFHPPFKKILFNINLKQNDGLLAHAVSDAFGTSYADACMLLEHFADGCRHSLKEGNPFGIPGVGRLYPGKEGNIQFEQDRGTNLLPDAFGLVSFTSPPVSRNNSLLGLDAAALSAAVTRPGTRRLVPALLRWAAILTLPVGLALVISLTQFNRQAGVNAGSASILGSVFSRFSSASLVEKKVAPAGTRIVAPKPEPVTPPVVTAKPETAVSAISLDDRYAIIVGAFRMQENAEKLIAGLRTRGIEATVYDRSRTGLFRVTIGTCADHPGAVQLLALAKSSDFPEAWLLAK